MRDLSDRNEIKMGGEYMGGKCRTLVLASVGSGAVTVRLFWVCTT